MGAYSREYGIIHVHLTYKGDVVCVCVCVFAMRGYNDKPVETKLRMVIEGPKAGH